MPDYPHTPKQKSKPQRHGIFHQSLVREFTTMGGLLLSLLTGIVVLSQLIRLLGDAVSGALAVDGILAMLGFAALNYLPILFSVSLFLSILLVLTRSYQDSEMVVWFSSGIGLTRWLRPVMWYALPVVGMIALMSLVLSPWALSKADQFKQQLDSRGDVAAAQPGMFRESKQADRVFFLDNIDTRSGRVGNIFVQSNQNGKMGVMIAKEGMQEVAPNGDKFVVMMNGTRYEGMPGQPDYKVAEFERYAIRLEAAESKVDENRKALTTLYLIQHPTTWNLSELEWRLGLPISALVLAILAIPLSFVNPRAGRSLNLIMAVVIYMLYNNMISVTNAWVGLGKIGPGIGLWGIHVLMMLVTVAWFYKRLSVYSWRRWLP